MLLFAMIYVTFVPKLFKKKKKNYKPIAFININTQLLNKIPVNQNQLYVKRIIHYDQVGFISGNESMI